VKRAVLGLSALALLAGCPLQTPTFEVISSGLAITVSSGAPLVGQTIKLDVLPAMGADLSAATWTTSDAQILSLTSSVGSSVMAMAVKPGFATVTVKAGSLRGAVAITALASIGEVDLVGPTSLTVGADATYSATVTDATGRKINATVTWDASGTVEFATPGGNTGSSMRIHAKAAGAGAVTAQAGGRSAQIAVKVSESSGQLVITRSDGTAIPATVAAGEALTVEASYATTNEPASDARWTAEGVCKLLGSSGGTLSVQATGSGACTLTATAKGMQATATFQIVSVTGVAIKGDTTTPLALGETRTFTAMGLAGMLESGAVGVTWSSPGSLVLMLQPASTQVQVTGVEVGTATLVASLPGNLSTMVSLTVAPTAIQLSASGSHVLAGAGTTVTAKAFGPMGKAGVFASAGIVTLAGATGFATVGPGVLQADGTVTFALGNAQAASPAVTASFAGVTSNSLSFSLAQVAGVTIMGPMGPVRVGSGVDFTAVPVDSTGARIDGDLAATWSDATGVYQFPATTTVRVTANAVKLGTASIVATVMGVASPPFESPAQPGSVSMTAFSPTSVAVGGKATALVTIFDAGGSPIPNVPLSQVSVAADDGTKVSFDAGAVMGMGFLFTATGLAPTSAAGVNATPTWTDGKYPVMGASVPLVVTP
jgi:hypothetical protein